MSGKWDASTLKVVQGLWAMIIATVMIAGAMFSVLPHLTEDGAFSRDDLYFVGGLVAVSLIVALPSVWMQLIGKGVTAFKAWKSGGTTG